MFTCHGSLTGTPGQHQHQTVTEARVCFGLIRPTVTVAAPVVKTPPPFGSRAFPNGPLSKPQFDYIAALKGDCDKARWYSYNQASAYINELKGARTVTAGSWTDPKLEMLKGLIDMVPDGYFAVQEYDGGHVEFIRLSTPKGGKFKDSRKFQTLHGSGLSLKLNLAATLWPLGQWSVYKQGMSDKLILLCADYQGAAMRYAEKMKRCCRCNAELTDGRSRWYCIGPECEKHWPWVIENVVNAKGHFTGER